YLIDNDITGVGREYQLTDAMDFMLKDGKVFRTATVTEWLDCGTIPALLDTTRIILQKEFAKTTGGAGSQVTDSTVIPPVYVGAGASITGSVVGPHVSVEAGATIRRSIVSDSIVFSNAVVSDVVLKSSLVGRN